MAWKLTIDGQEFREGELTIDEAEHMEGECGVTWRQLNPLRSAGVAKGIASVIYQRHFDLSEADARAKVGAMKVDELLDMVDVYDRNEDKPAVYENGIPQVGDESSTST